MKIAIIGARGLSASYGGIEKVLGELCPRLAASGFQIDVFAERSDASNPVESCPGVNVIESPCIPGKFTETITRSLLSTVRAVNGDYDLINLLAVGSGMLSCVPRMLGKPVVVSIHGLDWRRDKWPVAAQAMLRIAERMAGAADEITVVSRQLQEYFWGKYSRRVVFIPNGFEQRVLEVDRDVFSQFQLQQGEYILFASRLVPEKGAHELLCAFNGVSTNKRLVIAGGARYDLDYVRHLKSIDRTGRCLFVGHVTGNVLDTLFAGAYLYALPSHIEGLSLSLLEAIGFGKACVVSDIPENREVIGAAGFVFPVGNVDALRGVLQELVSCPDKVVEMERQARIRAASQLSWDEVATRYAALFRSVYSQRSRSQGRKNRTAE